MREHLGPCKHSWGHGEAETYFPHDGSGWFSSAPSEAVIAIWLCSQLGGVYGQNQLGRIAEISQGINWN